MSSLYTQHCLFSGRHIMCSDCGFAAPLKKLTSAERRNPNLLLKARGSVVVRNADPLMDTTCV